jgi:cytochrome c oxidase subunit 2
VAEIQKEGTTVLKRRLKMKWTAYLFAVVSLLFVVSGCASTGKTMSIQDMPDDAPIQKVSMTAEKFKFTPNTITVKKGTHLVLEITSTDVTHEFKLGGYDIYTALPANETVKVDIYTSKTGEFGFGCHLGLGIHYSKGMKGKIIVTE